uniref:Uncharacterized protein n=1 Tax=Physcomitrium patens TaxID=3218 RepID=A0A2K1JTN5_PHYPA|nr:hypothetical protein PHYPA_014659 [Physcomitrium patens]
MVRGDTIRAGTLPHEHALIADTESTIIYVPNSSCVLCVHHQAYFVICCLSWEPGAAVVQGS